MKGSKGFCFGALLLFCFGAFDLRAQSQEAQQLLLNVEKLSQLKNILSDMKKGYQIVSKGYNAVKDIAHGNFSLHEVFLDGLWLVSPQVRRYYRIADIVSDQAALVSEYRSAFRRFKLSGVFQPGELEYVSGVYERLFRASLDNLDQLAMVITARKMRMSDQERLEAIDRIFSGSREMLLFLRSFNQQATVLGMQREKEKADVNGLGGYFNGSSYE